MRTLLCIALGLAVASPIWAKAKDKAASEPSKDPRALLAAAAPFYDFSSADLKPWHLKATYQLFDENGKPTEQGTYEYWWASPEVYRSTWTREGASESDWMTDKGGYVEVGSGDGRGFYEYALGRELLSPFPKADEYSDANARLKTKRVTNGSAEVECVMVVSKKVGYDFVAPISMGLLPTFCIDTQSRALLASYSAGGLTVSFPQVVRTQGHYLAKTIVLSENGRKVLSATVDQIDSIAASDAAFTPSADAGLVVPAKGAVEAKGGSPNTMLDQVDEKTMAKRLLVHKVFPVYPAEARKEGVQGTVMLDLTIDKDGSVHDLRAVSTPSVLLLEPSMFAVSQWTYKPVRINGKPVLAETKIKIVFSLERF